MHARESERRLRQLQALRDALRQQAVGPRGARRRAAPEELAKASAFVSKLSHAIDASLDAQWEAAVAHGAHVARERRAAQKVRARAGSGGNPVLPQQMQHSPRRLSAAS